MTSDLGSSMLLKMVTSIAFIALHAMLTAAQDEMKPVLDIGSIKYYDIFSERIEAPYVGGFVQIRCNLDRNLVCTLSDMVTLVGPDSQSHAAVRCDDDVTVRLDITTSTKFGAYRCSYKGVESDESFEFKWRFCDASEDACSLEKSKSCKLHQEEYCLVTELKTESCAMGSVKSLRDRYEHLVPASWCHNDTGALYCPGRETSYCEALQKPYHPVTVQVNDADDCTSGSLWRSARVTYENAGRGPPSFNDVYMPYQGSWPTYYVGYANVHPAEKYPSCSEPTRVKCTLQTINGSIVESKNFCDCKRDYFNYVFNHSLFNNAGFQLLRFACVFEKNDTNRVYARVNNYLTAFGKPTISLAEPSDGNAPVLTCKLDPSPPVPFENVTYMWTANGHRVLAEQLAVGPNFTVTKSGNYCCFYEVTYRRCSPYREFRGGRVSEAFYVHVKTTAASTLGNVTTTDRVTSGGYAGSIVWSNIEALLFALALFCR